MASVSRLVLHLGIALGFFSLAGVDPLSAQTHQINFDDLGGTGVRAVDADRYRTAGLRLETDGAGLFVFGPSAFAPSAPDWLYGSQVASGGNADAAITLRFVSPTDGSPAVTDDVTFRIADGDHIGDWTVRGYDANNAEVALFTGTAASSVRLTGKVFHRVVFTPSGDFDGIDSLTFNRVAAPGSIEFASLVPFGKSWRWHHPTTNVDPVTTDADFHTTWYRGGAAYNGPAFLGPSPSPLGYGTLDLRALATNIGTPASGQRYSAYFTTTFDVADADLVRTLALDLLADDGAFIYLNGVLAATHNMPTGAADTYRQGAAGVDVNGISTEQAAFTLTLDPSLLVSGTNFLAVSIHNDSAASSDLGMDLRLTASVATIPEPACGTLLLVGAACAGFTRLIRRRRFPRVRLPRVAAALLLMALAYPAGASAQTSSSIFSAPFHLMNSRPQMGLPNPPTSGNFSGVTYSPITDSLFIVDNGASQIYEYTLTGAHRRTITTTGFDDPEGIAWLDGSRFAVVEEKTTHINIVSIEPGTSTIDKSLLPLADVIRPDLVPGDPSTGSLNPTGANTGIEGIAYNPDQNLFYLLKEKAEATPGDHAVNIFAVQPNGAASVLFNPSVAHGGATSALVSLAADAADLHFDRRTGNLLVLSHESRRIIEVTPQGKVLGFRAQPGTQIEGVSLSPDGSRLYVVGESREFLSYETSPQLTALVRPEAQWRYRDDGSNQGTAWRERTFDDATWKTGFAEFGYGDADERTIVRCGPVATCTASNQATTYFRHKFDAVSPQRVGELLLGIQRDDGAVVYLNGVEVYRDASLLANPAFNQYANRLGPVENPSEDFFVHIAIDPALLLRRGNVLAVEVHQHSTTDLDLSFNAQLTARYQPIPEPSTLLLAVLAAATLTARLGRRNANSRLH